MKRSQTCSKTQLNRQGVSKGEFYLYTHRLGLVESNLLELLRSLHTIKIYLPSKTELVPAPKASSHLGAFGMLMSSSTSVVVQDPSAPTPHVVHHDSVMIPEGFNCGSCWPATDGSLVYLLARTEHQSVAVLGAHTSWVLVYDWKTGRGLRIRLPEVPPRQTFAFLMYRLTPKDTRKVVGGRSQGLDIRPSYKTGGI